MAETQHIALDLDPTPLLDREEAIQRLALSGRLGLSVKAEPCNLFYRYEGSALEEKRRKKSKSSVEQETEVVRKQDFEPSRINMKAELLGQLFGAPKVKKTFLCKNPDFLDLLFVEMSPSHLSQILSPHFFEVFPFEWPKVEVSVPTLLKIKDLSPSLVQDLFTTFRRAGKNTIDDMPFWGERKLSPSSRRESKETPRKSGSDSSWNTEPASGSGIRDTKFFRRMEADTFSMGSVRSLKGARKVNQRRGARAKGIDYLFPEQMEYFEMMTQAFGIEFLKGVLDSEEEGWVLVEVHRFLLQTVDRFIQLKEKEKSTQEKPARTKTLEDKKVEEEKQKISCFLRNCASDESFLTILISNMGKRRRSTEVVLTAMKVLSSFLLLFEGEFKLLISSLRGVEMVAGVLVTENVEWDNQLVFESLLVLQALSSEPSLSILISQWRFKPSLPPSRFSKAKENPPLSVLGVLAAYFRKLALEVEELIQIKRDYALPILFVKKYLDDLRVPILLSSSLLKNLASPLSSAPLLVSEISNRFPKDHLPEFFENFCDSSIFRFIKKSVVGMSVPFSNLSEQLARLNRFEASRSCPEMDPDLESGSYLPSFALKLLNALLRMLKDFMEEEEGKGGKRERGRRDSLSHSPSLHPRKAVQSERRPYSMRRGSMRDFAVAKKVASEAFKGTKAEGISEGLSPRPTSRALLTPLEIPTPGTLRSSLSGYSNQEEEQSKVKESASGGSSYAPVVSQPFFTFDQDKKERVVPPAFFPLYPALVSLVSGLADLAWKNSEAAEALMSAFTTF